MVCISLRVAGSTVWVGKDAGLADVELAKVVAAGIEVAVAPVEFRDVPVLGLADDIKDGTREVDSGEGDT